MPILSLHVGGAIARTESAIIDPKKLQIIGFYVSGPLVDDETGNILDINSVRELSNLGMVVDSIDVLGHEDDVVRINKAIETGFQLTGLNVITKKGAKLGKVSDYVVDTVGFKIMQFTVKRPLLKGFLDPELIMSRKDIVEISNDKIVVRDSEEKVKKLVSEKADKSFAPDYVNPFRGGAYSESSDSE